MKKIVPILFILFALSCGEKEPTKDELRTSLQEKKRMFEQLQQEIDSLENLVAGFQTDRPVKLVSVSTQSISFSKFEHLFNATGSVEAVQTAYISPEINGQISQVHVSDGEHVKKGQLLVSLNAKVLKNTLLELKSNLKLAETIYQKQKGLWEQKIGSEIQFLEAKNQKESLENKIVTLQSQLDMAQVKAPFSGIVDHVYFKKGELVAPGQRLIDLVNLNKLYVNAEISETFLPTINSGSPVEIQFSSYPDIHIRTSVKRISHIINPKNRTFKVQMEIENRHNKLKPNMLAIISMKDFVSEKAIVVPSIAVKEDSKGMFLFVATEKAGRTIAEKIYVKTGFSQGDKTMITSGLSLGQQVIIEGYSLVKNGSNIQIVQ